MGAATGAVPITPCMASGAGCVAASAMAPIVIDGSL